jgi:pimeloyl-ACP methyl ester carboxylesterase
MWLKRIALGCGFMLVLFGAVAVWIGLMVREMTAPVVVDGVHPFKSAAKKERYLAHYDEWARSWPVPSEEVMIGTPLGETFVRISGPADGAPLVLLPGANATSLLWVPNVETWAEEYRIYAVDTIDDLGRSVSARKPTAPADYVAWLDDLFDGLGLDDQINLMGLSYGGWIAAEYGLAKPERLATLTLAAPAATVAWFSDDFVTKGLSCIIPHPHFIKSMVRWALHDAADGTPEERRLVEESADNAWIGLRCFKLRQMVGPRVLTDDEWRSFRVPVLLLIGENEVIYSISGEQAVARVRHAAPEIETELLTDCGHDLTIVQADRFNQRVLDFLAGGDSDPAATVE